MEIEDPSVDFTQSFDVALPTKVKNNGSMFLAVVSTPKEIPTKKKKTDIFTNPEATFTMVPFTLHQVFDNYLKEKRTPFISIIVLQVPEAETYNLLGGDEDGAQEKREAKSETGSRVEVPVTHIYQANGFL